MQWFYWLSAILLASAAGYWVYSADKRRATPYPWTTALLRALVIFFTLLLILVPTITITKNVTEQPIVLLLQDNSRSIANALGSNAEQYKKQVQKLTQRLGGKYKVVQWGFGSNVQLDSLFDYKQEATDISAALERAQEYYGMQNLGAVILATDGRYNQGANPLYQQSSMHSALFTVAIGDSAQQKDLRITRTYANKVVAINSNFEIRADIVAVLCKGYSGSVTIKEGNEVLSSSPVAVNSDRNDRTVSFTVKAAKVGLHHYTIEAPVADGEKNVANNRKDVFVEVVEEKKNILIISASPYPDVNAIKDALSGLESYKVTVSSADNPPSSLKAFNVIILHGLPSQRNNIASQVMAAGKPVWFIVTPQTSMPTLNGMAGMMHATINSGQPHNVLPDYRTSFNSFTLPKEIQEVTDKLPPLYTNAGSMTAAAGSSALFTQRGTGGQEPLWALQQGSVPTAVLLGEGIWRWRMYEYKNSGNHNVIDECIRQTVGFLSANNNEKPFNVTLPKYIWSDQEAITLNAYLLNANNEQVNTADVQITIADSAGRKQSYSMERSGTAYSLNIGIRAGGTYSYSAQAVYNGKTYTSGGSFAVESVPLELMETGADYPLLYGLARKYNGGFVTSANIGSLYDSINKNDRVKPLIVTNTETVPLVDRKWYFFIVLLIAAGEWLLRKYWLAQ